MKTITPMVVIAKDGYPLETFKGRPILNFIRRLLHGAHRECRDCYQLRTGFVIDDNRKEGGMGVKNDMSMIIFKALAKGGYEVRLVSVIGGEYYAKAYIRARTTKEVWSRLQDQNAPDVLLVDKSLTRKITHFT